MYYHYFIIIVIIPCTEIAQGIFKYSDIQYTGLTLDKITEQFDIQNTILCQHIQELQTSENTSVFCPTVYVVGYLL